MDDPYDSIHRLLSVQRLTSWRRKINSIERFLRFRRQLEWRALLVNDLRRAAAEPGAPFFLSRFLVELVLLPCREFEFLSLGIFLLITRTTMRGHRWGLRKTPVWKIESLAVGKLWFCERETSKLTLYCSWFAKPCVSLTLTRALESHES